MVEEPRDSRSILTEEPPSADERIAYGSGPYHFGDLRLPTGEGPFPVVINVHGGFWRAQYSLEHAGHPCAALTRLGYATWNLEYRRVGNEGGGWPGTFQDIAHGVNHVRELAPRFNLDLERVAVMGHSAGGHLALWVAARHRLPPSVLSSNLSPLPLRGIVSLAGVVDLRWASRHRLSDDGMATDRLMGGTPDEVPQRYDIGSPYELLPLGLPQRLLHGTDDERVPYEISERYVEKARAAGDDVTLIPLPGAGHFEVIDPFSAEWAKVVLAVEDILD